MLMLIWRLLRKEESGSVIATFSVQDPSFSMQPLVDASQYVMASICSRANWHNQESQTSTVNMDDDDPRAVDLFLRYLYTQNVCLDKSTSRDLDILHELFILTDKFNERKLHSSTSECFRKLFGEAVHFQSEWKAWISIETKKNAMLVWFENMLEGNQIASISLQRSCTFSLCKFDPGLLDDPGLGAPDGQITWIDVGCHIRDEIDDHIVA